MVSLQFTYVQVRFRIRDDDEPPYYVVHVGHDANHTTFEDYPDFIGWTYFHGFNYLAIA